MSETGATEGHAGVGRVEAFSDGVIAIIITIMVLELKAPEEPGLDHLWRLWPVFSAYALSFAYVGVYWVNHHRLFSHAQRVGNALVWLNLLLLFALSLVPFSTAYLGNMHFSRDAVLVYLATMILPSLAYVPLQRVIQSTGSQNDAAQTYHRQTSRKGIAALIIYLAGVPLTLITPWLGLGSAALVALLWFLPNSPFDGLFDS
ncbi:MAG: TMEM175 family protein [Pseudomonadota bacterium]